MSQIEMNSGERIVWLWGDDLYEGTIIAWTEDRRWVKIRMWCLFTRWIEVERIKKLAAGPYPEVRK